jgi:uncharacterized membrane protein YdjX (TVP38/TMEM64 family)
VNLAAKIAIRRVLPALLILIAILLFYFFEVYRYFSYEQLKTSSLKMQQLVAAHPVLSPVVYIAVYALALCLLLPVSLYFLLLAGFLFPQPWCTIYSLIATIIGCTVVFLVARSAWGDLLRAKARGLFARMKQGFQEDATSYLLALRFASILPFWATNIGPALFEISFATYFWTTALGLIPSRFLYTQAGRGLEAILDSGAPLSLRVILNPQMEIALICLALFGLMPILFRQIQKRRRRRTAK